MLKIPQHASGKNHKFHFQSNVTEEQHLILCDVLAST